MDITQHEAAVAGRPAARETSGARVRVDGQEDAFESWMRHAQPRLTRTAYLLTGEHHSAQDLVADALAKVYAAWSRIDPERRDAYARRTLVTTHTSWWRRAWRRREVTTDAPPERVSPTEDPTDRDEVWTRLATLPPRQRAVLVLRFYEQLTHAEIADVLGVAEGTVKSQSSRALATLRADLTTEEKS